MDNKTPVSSLNTSPIDCLLCLSVKIPISSDVELFQVESELFSIGCGYDNPQRPNQEFTRDRNMAGTVIGLKVGRSGLLAYYLTGDEKNFSEDQAEFLSPQQLLGI